VISAQFYAATKHRIVINIVNTAAVQVNETLQFNANKLFSSAKAFLEGKNFLIFFFIFKLRNKFDFACHIVS